MLKISKIHQSQYNRNLKNPPADRVNLRDDLEEWEQAELRRRNSNLIDQTPWNPDNSSDLTRLTSQGTDDKTLTSPDWSSSDNVPANPANYNLEMTGQIPPDVQQMANEIINQTRAGVLDLMQKMYGWKGSWNQ